MKTSPFGCLGAHNFPAHRTIRDFRAQHLQEFTELFTHVVCLASEMGLVKLGTIAADGTKVNANVIHHKTMIYARMQSTEAELEAQTAALLHKAAHTDEVEKNELELDLPAELERRQARLAAIEATKAQLQKRQAQADTQRGRSPGDERKPRDKDGEPRGGRTCKRDFRIPEPKAQSSFTDPDSRIMKRAGGGFDYSYNAQAAVDVTAHIILAAEVVNTTTDVQQLPTVLDAVQTHAGAQPAKVLVDAGYRSEVVTGKLAETHPDTELVIALDAKARQGKGCAQRRKPLGRGGQVTNRTRPVGLQEAQMDRRAT